MRILIASDKFKGTLGAREVCDAIASGLPDDTLVQFPIADGGEGTGALLAKALGGEPYEVVVNDALGNPCTATYWLTNSAPSRIGLLEMSSASGLAQIPPRLRNPSRASTFGTGQLLLAAANHGATELIIGIGGSATNDAGVGMAQALGYQFFDRDGQLLQNLPEAALAVHRIQPPTAPLPWAKPLSGNKSSLQVACDVINPLLGPKGATRVFGPQKGITDAAAVAEHEARLAHLAERIVVELGQGDPNAQGAGAAGGLGFGLQAFAQGQLCSGFDLLADKLGLREHIAQADLIITGEGRLDEQSLMGKGPVGVARLAKELGKPVVAICGVAEREARPSTTQAEHSRPLLKALTAEFTHIASLTDSPPDPLPSAEQTRGALTTLVKQQRPIW